MKMQTRWLGLDLKNPLVPSASPLSRSLDTAKQLEDAGAGALVMYSLFEEAVRAEEEGMERFLHHQNHGHAEADSYLPDHQDFPGELDRYLEQVAALKATLEIPVIASINGVTASGWIQHAKEIRDAGADALELNAYYIAADIREEGRDVEQRYVTLLEELRAGIDIPINMKLSPWFSSVGNLVKSLESAGVSGVSLFNRFYQPDINVHAMRLQHSLHPSKSAEALLAMRWVAILHGRLHCSIGATGGVHTTEDALKLLLAGADVVHLCTVLLQKGPQQLARILKKIEEWMQERGFESVSDFRGRLSQVRVQDPAEFERLNYIRVIDTYSFKPGVWT